MDRRKISCCNLLRTSASLIVAHLTLTRRIGSYDSYCASLNSWRSLSISLRRSFILSSSCLDICSCVWNTPEAKKKVFAAVSVWLRIDAPFFLWSNPKVLIWFWTSVSSELGPHCPQPDKAFSPLYAPRTKRWGGTVLELRPIAQPDPSPGRWFKSVGFSSSSLVLASKAPLVLKPAFLVHLGIVGRFHEGLNRVWYRPPGFALGYEEYPSLVARSRLSLTYCQR